MDPFRRVARNTDQAKELEGKDIYFALYAEGMTAEAKLLVNRSLAETIDCGKPLDELLASFRKAILDSARIHGNKTAPRA